MNRNDEAQMTALSAAAYAAAAADGLTAQSAAATLMQQIPIRSFREMLTAHADEGRLRRLLVDGLCANDGARTRASVDRKVRDWLGGKYQPTRREDLLELCFVLRLDAQRADAFLAAATGEGLHWREPRELAYAFALDRGMRYPGAKALFERVKPDHVAGDDMTESFSPLIRKEVQCCQTEDELREYLRSAAGRLGRLHNTAYKHFSAMLELLEAPASRVGLEERRYSTREIVKQYLDRKLPSARAGKNLEEKKRSILADWPDEVSLSLMKNRRMDVTRKVLILLFLATDDGDDAGDAQQEDALYDADALPLSGEEAADAAFRSTLMRLNGMLSDCGYRLLDPRSAFDWLVLYCIRVNGDAESMDGLNEQLTRVLEVLFAASRPEA